MKFKTIFVLTFSIISLMAVVQILVLSKELKLTQTYLFVSNNKQPLIDFNQQSLLQPLIPEKRVFEINLTDNKIYFFEDNQLKTIIPIAYQAPYGKWYQTPTGYFRVGVKKEKHISSLFPVYMNYAVQMYEDFFVHEIPYYFNGEQVTSSFTGGCIRLETDNAKKFFNLAQKGDLIISYLTFDKVKIKDQFYPPVDYQNFYIRQRFNSPLRTLYTYQENREVDYLQHAGLDLAPKPQAKDLKVYSIADGKVVKVVKNGFEDHGLGNTVIVEYQIDDQKIYALYGHLAEIEKNLKEGYQLKKGEVIGKVGATGYGCDYWKIGKDGCDQSGLLDIHLHLELKTKPVLESPQEATCNINNRETKCYGYVPHNPQNYGYFDPFLFLFENLKF